MMVDALLIKARAENCGERVRPFALAPAMVERVAVPQPPEPSAAEREADRLRQRVATLEQQLADTEARWQSQFDTRLADAAADIARSHRDDDAKRIAVLQTAVTAAVDAARTRFLAASADGATRLATHALSRLAAARTADVEFLSAVIADRIADVGEAMVVRILIAPVDLADGALTDILATQLPPSCRVEADAAIPRGTARIRLRLGQIDIDPARGLDRLIAALAAGPEVAHG